MSCDHQFPAASPSRRLLQTLALGGGATLLSTLPIVSVQAAGRVDVVLLSCMDYRLMDEVAVELGLMNPDGSVLSIV